MAEEIASTAQLYDRLGHLEREVAGYSAKFDGLERQGAAQAESVERQMRQLLEQIQSLGNRVNQPTNWLGIAGAIGGAFTMAIAFMTMTNAPIADKADQAISMLQSRSGLVYEAPKQFENINARLSTHTEWLRRTDDRLNTVENHTATHEKADEWSKNVLARIQDQIERMLDKESETSGRVSRLEGLAEELADTVGEIDSQGSRRWNDEVGRK